MNHRWLDVAKTKPARDDAHLTAIDTDLRHRLQRTFYSFWKLTRRGCDAFRLARYIVDRAAWAKRRKRGTRCGRVRRAGGHRPRLARYRCSAVDAGAGPIGDPGGLVQQAARTAQREFVPCFPYLRAQETTRLAAELEGLHKVTLRFDERLREQEFGILDRLTKLGIQQKYPDLNEQRVHAGKFYFRPLGGKSRCDEILRLRTLLETITREYAGRRVLVVVAHQIIVNCMRYLVEHMDEQQILGVDRQGDVPNCAVTSYRAHVAENEDQVLGLDLMNFITPLHEAAAPFTSAPDQSVAAKP